MFYIYNIMQYDLFNSLYIQYILYIVSILQSM